MTRNLRAAGFTLLELLVGLTLLGVLMILVYSALNMGLRAWDTGDARAAEAAHQRIVQTFLRREMEQIFPVRWRGIPESKIAFEGAKGELRFVTALNLGAAAKDGGLQWAHL
ncbi:MAG: prepilin-type N-terminal cleavage/methylation domain-containing protein, partial [Betaproteobacteria bacterium]|nr:prepilin-type N-terminal cleavage/methylation domain-containing protein [Betaproteobacteria bacterium]